MSDSSDSVKTAATSESKRHITVRRAKPVTVSRKMSIKIPAFAPEDPEIWFALLEGQFEAIGIEDDATKFTHVITHLDLHHAKAVKDIIVNPPVNNRYPKIKTELIRRLSASQENRVKQLLTHEVLGDRKPSQFLRHLLDLAGPSVPEDFIKTIWSNRLPNNIQTILASQPTHSLEQLSDLADRIQEITAPCQVAESSRPEPSTSVSGEIAELRGMIEKLALKLDQRSHSPENRYRQSRTHRRRSASRQRSRSNSSYRKLKDMLEHFKERHAQNCNVATDEEVELTNVDIKVDDRHLYLVAQSKMLFIITMKIDTLQKMAYWAIQHIGSKKVAHDHIYEIHVISKQNSRRKVVFTEHCFNDALKPDEVFRTGKCAVLPLDVLVHFMSNKKLSFRFFIKRIPGEPKNNKGDGNDNKPQGPKGPGPKGPNKDTQKNKSNGQNPPGPKGQKANKVTN